MNLIIIGASARAAAFSAHRAGLRPWCVDLFGDADLARRFPVRRIPLDNYPHGLLRALADAPDGPVLYTGGLENYPGLIARINRPLWGNSPEVLRRVRSPYVLDDMLRRHGLPALALRADPPSAADSRRWLLKPLAGSGGLGIRPYRSRPVAPPYPSRRHSPIQPLDKR
jgi:predicted ATP-grasp superfamily ATP-dependent carboligase